MPSLIEIIEGSFPAQNAFFFKKSAFLKRASLSLKGSDGKKILYDVRNAVQSIDIIAPDKWKPGIRIALKDDKIIVARTTRKTIEDIQMTVAAGPEENGDLFISSAGKKNAGDEPPHPVIAMAGQLIAWTIGVLLAVVALVSFSIGASYAGAIYLVMAIAIVPPVLPKVPVFKNKPPVSKAVSLILVGIIALIIGLFYTPGSTPKVASTQAQAKQQAMLKAAAAEPWSYSQKDDAMSKGKTYYASVSSSNTVKFKFPYSGAQNGELTLRTDPKYGKDVMFSIEKGQILCPSYDECTVLVRFDDEDAVSFTAIGAADNSTETIFIRNYSRFVEKMMKAKRVRISVNIYQEGSPVFDFNVSGFNQDKYRPKT